MSRRFWQSATADGLGILLDGKPLRLPSGARLRATTPALAHALAREWQAAPTEYGPHHLPLTGLAGATQERVGPNPAAMAATLSGYAAADLLCYLAPEPPALLAAQQATWLPWLDWAEQRHGARLLTTQGLTHIAQPPRSLAALEAAFHQLPAPTLAALGLAIPILGSAVLGLALAERAASSAVLFAAASLEESFQASRWGEDASALAARENRANEVALAARFMDLAATGETP